MIELRFYTERLYTEIIDEPGQGHMQKIEAELQTREAQSERLEANTVLLTNNKEKLATTVNTSALDDQLYNMSSAYEMNEKAISEIKTFIEKYEQFLEQE